MTSCPPRRGAQDASHFDGSNPLDLPRYFKDIEYIAVECNLGPADQVQYMKYYASMSVAKLWETDPALAATASNWDLAKKTISKFYPALSPGARFTRDNLKDHVNKWKNKGIQTCDDFGEYKHEFLIRLKYLQRNSIMNEEEVSQLFVKAFLGRLKEHLQLHLEMKVADPAPGKPYSIMDVITHADYILASMAFDEAPWASTQSTPSVTIKKEEVNIVAIWETLKSLQVCLDLMGQHTGSSSGTIGLRNTVCAFCSKSNHFVRSCPVATKYVQLGKCACNNEGQIATVSRLYILGSTLGKNLKERIDYLNSKNSSTITALVNLVKVARNNEKGTVVLVVTSALKIASRG